MIGLPCSEKKFAERGRERKRHGDVIGLELLWLKLGLSLAWQRLYLIR